MRREDPILSPAGTLQPAYTGRPEWSALRTGGIPNVGALRWVEGIVGASDPPL
jgi:hypothetical protein